MANQKVSQLTAASALTGVEQVYAVQSSASRRTTTQDIANLAPATDLTYTASTRVLASSTGTDATLPVATASLAGLLSAADKSTIDGLSTVATTGAYADLSGKPTLGTAAAESSTAFAASGAITSSSLTMATARLLGRATASTGAIEEISLAGGLAFSSGALTVPVEIGLACSDETSALTTGTSKVTFRLPYAMTLTAVRASVTTAPTGSTLVVDINEAGVSILSTKLSIDATEKTSTTAATAAVISDSALADDAEISIDIDQIGSTVAGAGLKVWLIGRRA